MGGGQQRLSGAADPIFPLENDESTREEPEACDSDRYAHPPEGYKKSLYPQDWFDSSTERTIANVLDDDAWKTFTAPLRH